MRTPFSECMTVWTEGNPVIYVKLPFFEHTRDYVVGIEVFWTFIADYAESISRNYLLSPLFMFFIELTPHIISK